MYVNIDTIINRLKAEQDKFGNLHYSVGFRAGKRWAETDASTAELNYVNTEYEPLYATDYSLDPFHGLRGQFVMGTVFREVLERCGYWADEDAQTLLSFEKGFIDAARCIDEEVKRIMQDKSDKYNQQRKCPEGAN